MDGSILIDKVKIESWLRLRGWNQKELAAAVNYDEGNLSRIINGDLEPSKQFMKKIILLTGLDLSLFLFDRNHGAVSSEE
jgi:transcriptional regulator with XRE-family HTH domain